MIPVSRRRFIAGLGGAAVASRLAPFLPVGARAAEAPRRLVVVFMPQGYLEAGFWPRRTSETEFELGETMTALQPWKSKLIYPDGLELYGARQSDDNEHGKGIAMVFTGSRKQGLSTGPSVDQAVADHLYAQQKTRFRALGLGVNGRTNHGHNCCFFIRAQTPVNPDNSPRSVFDTIFKDVQPGAAPMVDSGALARLQRQKKSVIDLVKEDLDRVCRFLGAEERAKCEAHLDGVRMLEGAAAQAAPAATVGCTKPAAPAGGDLVATTHAQMDNAVAALACDLTRVVTLQMGFADGGIDPFPGLSQHATAHAVGDSGYGAGPVANHKRFDRWFADRWAYFFKRLESVREGNGTLLDNTLVLFGSDTTTRTGAHYLNRFTYFMAGGGNFAFRTGRHVVVSPNPKEYVPSNRLLVSICRAFGMPVDKFGNLDPGSGPLVGL